VAAAVRNIPDSIGLRQMTTRPRIARSTFIMPSPQIKPVWGKKIKRKKIRYSRKKNPARKGMNPLPCRVLQAD
jgi:hypothetical protein